MPYVALKQGLATYDPWDGSGQHTDLCIRLLDIVDLSLNCVYFK